MNIDPAGVFRLRGSPRLAAVGTSLLLPLALGIGLGLRATGRHSPLPVYSRSLRRG